MRSILLGCSALVAACSSGPAQYSGRAQIVLEATGEQIALDRLTVLNGGGCGDVPLLVRWESSDQKQFLELRLPLADGSYSLCYSSSIGCVGGGMCPAPPRTAGVSFTIGDLHYAVVNDCAAPVAGPGCSGTAVTSSSTSERRASVDITGAVLPLGVRPGAPLAVIDAHALATQ